MNREFLGNEKLVIANHILNQLEDEVVLLENSLLFFEELLEIDVLKELKE
jgi:hypothetical protein